jgi:uncharacterized protein with GYD domain
MPTYVTLVKWTEQGMKGIKDLPIRFEEAGKAMEAMGGKFLSAYVTMGLYDMVVISEGPNDEAASTAALAIASQGNLQTTTMRAFTPAEFAAILKKVP